MKKKEVRIQERQRTRGMTTFAPNDFALKNHTPGKGSHFAGGFDNLMSLIKEHWVARKPGFTDGCWEITLPVAGFFTGLVDLRTCHPDALRCTFAKRDGVEGDEEPMLTVRAPANLKAPAVSVRVICYSHELLGAEATTSADFELVTILAEPGDEPAPMPPVTMARNFLAMEGGTKGSFSAEDFAKSIVFWAQHVVAADPE
jgi:hypothetical protein